MKLLLLVFFSLLTGFEVTFGDENDGIFKDRTAENIPGAATKPYVKTLNQTQYWALLQCEVRGSFPKPKLHWQDSDGNILHAEEPKVTERGGRYDVILNITVTKTNIYRCVATQEEINHQIYSEIYMYIYDRMLKDRTAENITGSSTGLVVSLAVFGAAVFLGVGCCII